MLGSKAPLIEPIREAELGTLPPIVVSLLEWLKERLPQQAEIAEARWQAEIAAAEKAKLQRQKVEEKIKTTQRRPKINFRVGVYGDWWPLPADRIIEMPAELIDCNTKDE